MASLPSDFDLEAILAPIPGDQPQGADLRADYSPQAAYFRLRDARTEARTQERLADAAGQDGGAGYADAMLIAGQNWRLVADLAPVTIANESKDLEIAAWYTEAMVRIHGLPGLTAGAMLMQGLADQFWDGLYPLPDEDGMETRVSPVTGLNGQGSDGTLIQPLNKTALFERPDGSPYALWNFERTTQLAGIADKARRDAALESGVIPLDDMTKEARANGGARFARLLGQAREALEAWQVMGRALDAKAGADGPPTSRVAEVVQRVIDFSREFAPAGSEDAAPEDAAAIDPVGGQGTPVAATAQVMTRESALKALAELASYFRRTEPHSPLAYTLDEAVRRGRMTWPELLAEIVPDQTVRDAMLNTLGIRPAEPES